MHVYIVAIGGTGMAPLACLLQNLGHRVTGVDGKLYPPMSTLLEAAGIEPLEGYDAAHLDPSRPADQLPDLVVMGNAVPRTNPEAEAAEHLRQERGTEILSMPEALSRFLLADRSPLVCAGTHGKTTTSSMAAWVLHRCARSPGWLVGGIPQNLGRSFAVGEGRRFVVEGDEYNAAYFDRGPKFLHYRPHTLILTSVEYDHADLYPSHEALLDRYRQLVRLVPPDGLVIACGDPPSASPDPDMPTAAELARRAIREGISEDGAEDVCAAVQVVAYGVDPSNDVHPLELSEDGTGTSFRVEDRFRDGGLDSDGETIHLRVAGRHNLQNALAVWTAARFDGIPAADVAAALGEFEGAKRRLEELGSFAGVTVVDDFAHHPTAVAASLGGLRQRYPGRRIVLCYEPRSLTAGRAFFSDAYRRAFAGADVVHLAPAAHDERLRREGHDVVDFAGLVDRLGRDGVDARLAASTDDLLANVVETKREGDVVATMSSGSFDGLPLRLAEALRGTGSRGTESRGTAS